MGNLVSDIFAVPSARAHSMNHVGSISVLHTMIGDYFPTWFLHHSSLPCDYLCRAQLGSGRKVEPLTPLPPPKPLAGHRWLAQILPTEAGPIIGCFIVWVSLLQGRGSPIAGATKLGTADSGFEPSELSRCPDGPDQAHYIL